MIISESSVQYWNLLFAPPPAAKHAFHRSSDQWIDYGNCFWRFSFILQKWTAPSSSRCTCWECRRRWITFFETSYAERECFPGSISSQFLWFICEGCGDVVGVLTLLVGGAAQAFHDDRVVELRVQLGVEEVRRKRQGGTGRSRKGETSQRGCAMLMTMDECEKTQDLSQWGCETTSSVKECALRARSTHGVHHANCRGQHRHWCRAWWGACCACYSTCCNWSHTWSHRSCCNCRFRRSHFT